jgi:hypothetical protein
MINASEKKIAFLIQIRKDSISAKREGFFQEESGLDSFKILETESSDPSLITFSDGSKTRHLGVFNHKVPIGIIAEDNTINITATKEKESLGKDVIPAFKMALNMKELLTPDDGYTGDKLVIRTEIDGDKVDIFLKVYKLLPVSNQGSFFMRQYKKEQVIGTVKLSTNKGDSSQLSLLSDFNGGGIHRSEATEAGEINLANNRAHTQLPDFILPTLQKSFKQALKTMHIQGQDDPRPLEHRRTERTTGLTQG